MDRKARLLKYLIGVSVICTFYFCLSSVALAAWGEEGGVLLFNGTTGRAWLPVEQQPGQYGQFAQEQNATLYVDIPEGLGREMVGITSRKHLLLVPPQGDEAAVDFEFDSNRTDGFRLVISDGPLDRKDSNVVVLWWGSRMMGFMNSLEEKHKSVNNTSGWTPGVFTLYISPGKLMLMSAPGTVMEVEAPWAMSGTQIYFTLTGYAYYEKKPTYFGLRKITLLPPPPDPELFKAGLDEAFEEYDLQGEKLFPFIEVPEISHVPLPEPGDDSATSAPDGTGACAGQVLSSFLAEIPNYFVSEAVADEGCDKPFDEFINQQRRIEATLGKTSDVGGALKNLFWEVVGKSEFSKGFLETVRKNLDLAGATWDYGKAGYEGYQAGSPEKMALAMTQMTLKVMLDSCKTKADLKQLNGVTRNMLASALKKMNKEQRKKVLEQLSVALGRQKEYAEALGKGLDISFGDASGQAVEGNYKEALFTVTSSAVIAFVPQVGIAKAAVTVAWESAKATRDWVVDENVADLYNSWREQVGGGGMGARDFYEAHSMHDSPALLRTRSLMRALGMGVDKNGNELPITNAEAEKFLEAKFKKWYAIEQEGEKRADAYSRLKDEFQGLDPTCKSGLRSRLWPKGLYGATYQYNKYRDPCYYEKIMFEEYAKLQGRIRGELEKWRQKGRKGECDGDRLDHQAGRLACRLLSSGEDAYRSYFATTLNDCKLLPVPKELMVESYRKRVEERMTGMRSANATRLLQHMEQIDLLQCLCNRYSIMGSGCSYHPEGLKGCPSGGPCVQGNWGCTRKPLPTDEKAMAACQIAKRMAEDAVNKRLAGDIP